MKRTELLKHPKKYDCELLREGARHSWRINPQKNQRFAIPRHSEINDLLANKICKDLGINKIK